MSEITAPAAGRLKKAGVQKLTKQSTRVDLTPMVDLGFLLITFFIFTTNISQARAMTMVMPNDGGPQTPVKQSEAITLLLGNNNTVWYYEGILQGNGANLHTSNSTGIRDVLLAKKRTPYGKMVVIIKPTHNTNYKHLLDVLDEMLINDIKRYVMVDVTAEEESLLMPHE